MEAIGEQEWRKDQDDLLTETWELVKVAELSLMAARGAWKITHLGNLQRKDK